MTTWGWTIGPLLLAVAAEQAEPDATIVLQARSGHFLRVTPEGAFKAAGLDPAEPHQFSLFSQSGGRVALRASDGRFLASTTGGQSRRLTIGLPDSPSDAERFLLVPVEGNRVAMMCEDSREFVLLDPDAAESAKEGPRDEPRPAETIGIFRCRQVPDAIRTALELAIQGGIIQELGDKQYSKIAFHDTDRYITLPAPTLRDPGRKKRHQILGVREEYHVEARLFREPTIRISRMSYLTGYFDPGVASILFVAEARLPVQGHVSYKVPKLLSATTGYETTVVLGLVGEIVIDKAEEQISVGPPRLHRIGVAMEGLDLSNDILHSLRRPIERAINGELRKNNARIRAEANEELADAVEGREFHHPLLRYLSLP